MVLWCQYFLVSYGLVTAFYVSPVLSSIVITSLRKEEAGRFVGSVLVSGTSTLHGFTFFCSSSLCRRRVATSVALMQMF